MIDDTYKSLDSVVSILPVQILKDRPPNKVNQYSNMIQENIKLIQTLHSQDTKEDLEKYVELCTRFSITFAGPVPDEIFTSTEFFDFIDFICQVLTQTSNADIILYTLKLIPPIVIKNYSTVKEFEIKEIDKILFQFIQSDNNDIIEESIICVSYLFNATDNCSIYEFLIDNQILHELCSRSEDIKASVLFFCSSVLNRCQPYYEKRDILIQIGLETFEIREGSDFTFLHSLRRLFKICSEPKDIYMSLQSESEEDSFLYKISRMIDPTQSYNPAIRHILKLFYTMIKYAKESIPSIIDCIKIIQDNIILICQTKQDDPKIISISYKILCYVIPSNCKIIEKLFDQEYDFSNAIFDNIENGNFYIRKSAIRLSKTIMKYGTFFQQTNLFYSPEFVQKVSPILFTDVDDLILLALELLEMIAKKALNENMKDVIEAFDDQLIQETLEEIKEKFENISNSFYNVFAILQPTSE